MKHTDVIYKGERLKYIDDYFGEQVVWMIIKEYGCIQRDNLMTGDWISDSRDLEERLFCHEKRNTDNR